MQIGFYDIFSADILNKVYSLFESHINQDTLTGDFPKIIQDNVLQGRDWEKLQTVLSAYEIDMNRKEACEFLEINCFKVWFAKKQIEGHQFNHKEKSALAGFAFYADADEDEDISLKQHIMEQRTACHEEFVNKVFEMNIKNYVSEYKAFIKAEADKLN